VPPDVENWTVHRLPIGRGLRWPVAAAHSRTRRPARSAPHDRREAAGARRLVLAVVVTFRSDLDNYRQAVPGAQILVVRLRAAPATLHQRIRHRGQGLGMQWHLDRAVELAPQMDAQRLEDLLIETDGCDPTSIARDILDRAGWLASDHAAEPV